MAGLPKALGILQNKMQYYTLFAAFLAKIGPHAADAAVGMTDAQINRPGCLPAHGENLGRYARIRPVNAFLKNNPATEKGICAVSKKGFEISFSRHEQRLWRKQIFKPAFYECGLIDHNFQEI